MKQNTTNEGFLGLIEKIIRLIPHIYIFFRWLVKYTDYFESDFYYLEKIFKTKKINIIDVGASDGISCKFFLNNLKVNKIFCYEPQQTFHKDLEKLAHKNKGIKIKKYGLSSREKNETVYVPYINIFGKTFYLSTYTFPKKENLIKQIKIDFLISPLIGKIKLRLKKFEILRDRIQLIKIDTNGSEKDIINSLIRLIKRDKPVLIIENNDVKNIYKILKKYNYQKYFVNNNKLLIHSNQNSGNVIFKQKL